MKRMQSALAWFGPCLVFLFLSNGTLNAQQRSVTIVGTVTEEISGEPVSSVTVLVDGIEVGSTNRDGRFTASPVRVVGETVSVAFQRIGYQRRFETLQITRDEQVVELNVTLLRFPTILEEITVDGRQITIRNPGLIGFYQRREEDFGWYLTEEEIDRSIGFTLDNFYRRMRLPAKGCGPLRPLVVFLDGIRVPPYPGQESPLQRINDMVMPGQVGGIEAYGDERAVRLPRELIPAGPYCGIVAFWTRQPKGPSSGRFAGYVSSGFGQPATSRLALGGGIAFPLRSASTLEFQGGIHFVLDGGPHVWRVFADATGKPLGSRSPWFIGLGITVVKPRGGLNAIGSQTVSAKPTLLTGLRAPTGLLQPFVEARVVDVFRPSDLMVLTLLGLSVHFGSS